MERLMRMKAVRMPTKKLYIIAGPTAVGKTDIAIRLAQRLHTSIISADSRQCYKEMTIGTAKPTDEELQTVSHFFINDFSIEEAITAADYERLALAHLELLFSQKDTAVVCGGTGLYLKALCEGLDEMPEIDKTIETAVNNEYLQNGLPWLQETVQKEDALFYAQGEIQNPARLLRALIFKRSTGKSILAFRSGQQKERPFETVYIVLELPRQQLYERIHQRVDKMMNDGLLEEVKGLYPYRHLKNLQTVGYVELFDYLENRCTLTEAVEKIKQHTRNYAKRQITWFKKVQGAVVVPADAPDVIERILAN